MWRRDRSESSPLDLACLSRRRTVVGAMVGAGAPVDTM
jgi:hypothetical protein